jgi:hypothetical protein
MFQDGTELTREILWFFKETSHILGLFGYATAYTEHVCLSGKAFGNFPAHS